jgi:hypothetical protein
MIGSQVAVRLSALRAGRALPEERLLLFLMILVLISVRG